MPQDIFEIETAFGNNISVKLSIVTQVAIYMHIFVW